MDRMLYITGLGPGEWDQLSVGAARVLKSQKKLWVRTLKHPVIDRLIHEGTQIHSFDTLYDTVSDFDCLYRDIVEQLMESFEKDSVIYAVPGSPLVGEKTVELLIERAQQENIPYKVVVSPSCIETVLATAGMEPSQGVCILESQDLSKAKLDPRVNLLLLGLEDRMVAAQVKLDLMTVYSDEKEVILVSHAGIEGKEKLQKLPLYQLDHQETFDYMTTLVVPRVLEGELAGQLEELVDIMTVLRSPEGCPWDLKQTHRTLIPYLIEESYEVLDAIEKEDVLLLEEELGDLLLQIVFHAQIAKEQGSFTIQDVIRGICDKMINRHPHVFSNVKADTAEDVLVNWEAIKKTEKEEIGQHSSMQRIPRHLPALMRSWKVQQKAADVGFDWDSIEGAVEKVHEELNELLELLGTHQIDAMEEELGDLLFAVVNVARFLKIGPEEALQRTTEKFMRRYKYVEEKSLNNGIDMKNCGIEVLDRYWNEAKRLEKQQKTQKKSL